VIAENGAMNPAPGLVLGVSVCAISPSECLCVELRPTASPPRGQHEPAVRRKAAKARDADEIRSVYEQIVLACLALDQAEFDFLKGTQNRAAVC
jgi:hypothetical protein